MPYNRDLEDFSDQEIVQECEARGIGDVYTIKQALVDIYQLSRLGKPYENELNKLICDALGVVI